VAEAEAAGRGASSTGSGGAAPGTGRGRGSGGVVLDGAGPNPNPGRGPAGAAGSGPAGGAAGGGHAGTASRATQKDIAKWSPEDPDPDQWSQAIQREVSLAGSLEMKLRPDDALVPAIRELAEQLRACHARLVTTAREDQQSLMTLCQEVQTANSKWQRLKLQATSRPAATSGCAWGFANY